MSGKAGRGDSYIDYRMRGIQDGFRQAFQFVDKLWWQYDEALVRWSSKNCVGLLKVRKLSSGNKN